MPSTRPVLSYLLCIGKIEVLPFSLIFMWEPFPPGVKVAPRAASQRLNSRLFMS